MKSIVTILIILSCLGVAHATTYHVRTDGHDTASGLNDTNDPTTGALLTLGHCIGVHATTAGDTCRMHAGTYTEWQPTTGYSGTAENLITIEADGADVVNIKNLKISHDYVKVDKLNVVGSYTWGTPGIYVGGNNCEITNNNFWGGRGMEPAQENYAIETHGDNNTIDNNVFDGESTSTVSWFIVFSVSGTGNVYTNNTIKNIYNVERVWDAGGDDASHLASDNTIVRSNEVFSLTWSGAGGVHPDIIQMVNNGTSNNTANYWIVERNYFHDCNSQIGINEIPSARHLGFIFRNNVVANVNQAYMLGGVVYNNTFFHCGGEDGASDLRLLAMSGTSLVKNNIVIAANTNANDVGITLPTSCAEIGEGISNNYYSKSDFPTYTARSATVIGGANIVCSANVADQRLSDSGAVNGGDPKFVAAYNDCVANTCDFSLQSDSPLLGMGADLSASFTTDYAGNTRTVPFDIGAYEYQSGAGNTTLGSGSTFSLGSGAGFTLQ